MEMIEQYIAIDEAFFVLIAFLGFLFLFIKFAWPKVGGLLDNRSTAIRDQLTEATRLREEAQATLAAYQKRQREAMEETEEMLKHAKIQVENMKIDAQADLKLTLNRRLMQAKERIARAEEAAVSQVQAQITDVSLDAAQTMIEGIIEEEGDDALTSEAISEAPRLIA